MRAIYIDVLITVNMFIDFFLILCTKKSLHLNVTYKRMIFGSITGGFLSIIALVPQLIFLVNILVDIAGACLIVFVTFGKSNVRTYLKRVLVYFSFSFSFCGIMIFLYTSFKPNGMAIYNDVVYFNISPAVLIILTLICYYILKLIKKFLGNSVGSGVCNIEISAEGKIISFAAKIDTGCNLKEPFSGNLVIIIEKILLENYAPDESKMRVIPFGSLGGTGIIKGFKPDKIEIDGTEISNDVYIGICENVIKGDVKALIPGELAKKQN